VTDSWKSFRDPLHLTFFVSDPIIIVAWFGLFLFFWPGQRVALLTLAVPFAVIYAAAVYTHIFGDNRHAHPLIPIIIGLAPPRVVRTEQDYRRGRPGPQHYDRPDHGRTGPAGQVRPYFGLDRPERCLLPSPIA